MGINTNRLQHVAVFVIGMVTLASCASWNSRYRPVDIDKDMPSVSELVRGVQKSIDETANHDAWKPSSPFSVRQRACKLGRAESVSKHDSACKQAYLSARKDCRRSSGVAAPSLCTDFFRQATQICTDATDPDPPACAEAKLIAPPRITEARLQLTAAAETGGGASIEYLTLLSAKASRKLGRKHTLEITLIPRPEEERQYVEAVVAKEAVQPGATEAKLKDAESEARELLVIVTKESGMTEVDPAGVESIKKALNVALDAALITGKDPRQLTLKRMFYQFEIDFSRELGGELKWSISPLSGTVQGKSGSEAGNILTIEVVR